MPYTMKQTVGDASVLDETNGVTREQANINILKVYQQIKKTPELFKMASWHEIRIKDNKDCGTSHCLAGWAHIMFEPNDYFSNYKQNFKKYIEYSGFDSGTCEFGKGAGTAGEKHIWPICHVFTWSDESALGEIEEYIEKWEIREVV